MYANLMQTFNGPREQMRVIMASVGFTFADLFCGIGGMRLGLERAGGRCVFSSEINKYAVETYEANFRDMPSGDIKAIRASDIPDHDVLAAGFPCQPFSLAGVSKRNSIDRPSGLDMPEGNMFDEIVRVLRSKKPPAFLLENVKHLKSYDGGSVFGAMVDKLQRAGYGVSHDVINARAVVPQHRERLFVVGFREGVGFDFPSIKDRSPKLKHILERDPGDGYVLTPGVWAALKRHKERSKKNGSGFGYSIADPDGASRTMSRRYYKDGAEILIRRGGRGTPRRLTPHECARLMGFPDSFVIPVSDTQAYRQFGNSVVPEIVAKIGERMAAGLNRGRAIAVPAGVQRSGRGLGSHMPNRGRAIAVPAGKETTRRRGS